MIKVTLVQKRHGTSSGKTKPTHNFSRQLMCRDRYLNLPLLLLSALLSTQNAGRGPAYRRLSGLDANNVIHYGSIAGHYEPDTASRFPYRPAHPHSIHMVVTVPVVKTERFEASWRLPESSRSQFVRVRTHAIRL